MYACDFRLLIHKNLAPSVGWELNNGLTGEGISSMDHWKWISVDKPQIVNWKLTWKCGPLHGMAGTSPIIWKKNNPVRQFPITFWLHHAAGLARLSPNLDKNQINAITSHMSSCCWLLSCYIQWQDTHLIRTIPHYIRTRKNLSLATGKWFYFFCTLRQRQ